MLTRARTEIAECLAGLPLRRPPAVRRAIPDGWMLACDLPQCADPETVQTFIRRTENAGWRTELQGSWILLDKPETISYELCTSSPTPSEERSCVLSLLSRHPALVRDPAVLRALAKASELSPAAAEPEYRRLHQLLAVRLRTKT